MNKGLWYFAHPYTAKDNDGNYVSLAEEANFRICNIRAGELLRRGYNIYSPISHTHPIHIATPKFLKDHEHEMWYHLDNQVIDRTRFDGIILAPEWETSSGCVAEKKKIEGMGGKVLYYTDIIYAPASPPHVKSWEEIKQ